MVGTLVFRISKVCCSFHHIAHFFSLTTPQALFDESQSCIADCEEAPPENHAEEAKAASDAVDRAFAAYIDLLEDLRRADQTQENKFRDVREQNATRLKLLRRELDAILERS